ncbi:hypothetical protein ACO2Q1_16440 [Brevundimonas sp. VNH65]|uniref:hypothetical protein n=1 Tax=Brevundimonas sp. VNH65 TaxID=3400917 RepID=UPI003C0D1B3A
MEYEVERESADGSRSVQALIFGDVVEAYDHCVAGLEEDASLKAVHLGVAGRRIHSVKRRP